MTPWTDRSGKISPLKIAVLVGACLPALWLVWAAFSGALAQAVPLGPLGARPITEAIHQTGDWTIRLLLMSLAVTPSMRRTWISFGQLAMRLSGVTASDIIRKRIAQSPARWIASVTGLAPSGPTAP